MNNLTPYEILIAQKAGQVTVPDMADSIWANIEAGLDAGPGPGDGDGNSGPSKTPPVKGLPGAGNIVTIVTVAAIAIAFTWLFTRNKKHEPTKTEQPSISPATQVAPSIRDSNQSNYQAIPKNVLIPLPIDKDIVSPVDNQSLPVIDTSTHLAIPAPNKPDSAFVFKNDKLPVLIDSSLIKPAVLPPPKKGRGVKGISSDDYKIISGKKDTTKKNN